MHAHTDVGTYVQIAHTCFARKFLDGYFWAALYVHKVTLLLVRLGLMQAIKYLAIELCRTHSTDFTQKTNIVWHRLLNQTWSNYVIKQHQT